MLLTIEKIHREGIAGLRVFVISTRTSIWWYYLVLTVEMCHCTKILIDVPHSKCWRLSIFNGLVFVVFKFDAHTFLCWIYGR